MILNINLQKKIFHICAGMMDTWLFYPVLVLLSLTKESFILKLLFYFNRLRKLVWELKMLLKIHPSVNWIPNMFLHIIISTGIKNQKYYYTKEFLQKLLLG